MCTLNGRLKLREITFSERKVARFRMFLLNHLRDLESRIYLKHWAYIGLYLCQLARPINISLVFKISPLSSRHFWQFHVHRDLRFGKPDQFEISPHVSDSIFMGIHYAASCLSQFVVVAEFWCRLIYGFRSLRVVPRNSTSSSARNARNLSESDVPTYHRSTCQVSA
jgi:hypothetical protein